MKKDRGLPAQAGFIQIIILIIIFLFILKFMGLTITDVITWFKTTFDSVLK